MSPVMFSVIFKLLCAIVWAVLSIRVEDNRQTLYKSSAITLVRDAEDLFMNWHDFINHPEHDERRML